MKKLLLGLLLLAEITCWGQSDSTAIPDQTLIDASDSIYKKLNAHVTTGFLLNRALTDTLSEVFQLKRALKDSAVSVNDFYLALNDLNKMNIAKTPVQNLDSLFYRTSTYLGTTEFEDEKLIFPMGVLDFNYNWVDEKRELKAGRIIWQDSVQFTVNGDVDSIFQSDRVQLIAPLFDYASTEIMGIVFRQEDFYSNVHTVNDVDRIEVVLNRMTTTLQFDEVFEFEPTATETQEFQIKLYYTNGDSIVNTCLIHTPELANEDQPQFRSSDEFGEGPGINPDYVEMIEHGNLKLKAYVLKGCGNESNFHHKPYLLITGFRPPIFGQSGEKTWSIYNDNHDHLLQQLRLNGYDVILVKFNMDAHPYTLGMPEMADLLVEYLDWVNVRKEIGGYGMNENVIQGSSLGASVAKLALLKMENKHRHDNNYPHHHTRLFISYDANHYGANLPLAYQLQAYSGVNYPMPVLPAALAVLLPPGLNALAVTGSVFLQVFLRQTLEQKATKELLTYHAKGMGNEGFVGTQSITKTWTPTHTQLRQNFLNMLDNEYNQIGYYPHGKLFMPIPTATRNVAISLGKVSEPNSENTQNLQFNTAGQNWRNVNVGIYQHILRAAQHTSSKLIFKRLIGINIGKLHLNIVNQELNVSNMQEIDNSAGSYLGGVGNFIGVANLAYGFNWFNIFNQPQFTHKSVLSALAINKNVWPSNGSHTMNMKDWGLMYNNFYDLSINNPSNFFGYPNLGRPNDHFQVTPFEAVYISEYFILPHINYSNLNANQVSQYVTPINDFIKNEVEPCYLYLQNQHLGAQARSNYTYRSFRRANNMIVTGNLVTPSTDPGDYIVEPNAVLKLEAGEEIVLKAGTHIQAGANVHLKINYEPCPDRDRPCDNIQGMMQNHSFNDAMANHISENDNVDNLSISVTDELKNTVKIFPNPTTNSFTIETSDNITIQTLIIYNISGQLIDNVVVENTSQYAYEKQLKQGTYLLVIQTHDNKIIHKKLVVL